MKEKLAHTDGFSIYVDQLKGGHVEKIHEKFSPDFLDIHEDELVFEDPITVNGEAYIADSNLILHLEITTAAKLPCTICNETVDVPIRVHNLYHSESLSEIKSGVFSMLNVIREGILINTPSFAECEMGKCPKRAEINKYLKEAPSTKEEEEGTYRPFKDL